MFDERVLLNLEHSGTTSLGISEGFGIGVRNRIPAIFFTLGSGVQTSIPWKQYPEKYLMDTITLPDL